MKQLPLVLVSTCSKLIDEHIYHAAGKKYADAVRLAGALPLLVPYASPEQFDTLLELADGVLLTGSVSNVDPRHFDEAVADPSLPLDPLRDAWTLPFVPRLLETGVPLFAICRGMQEVNVALGGSLHQAVHDLPAHLDHRAPAGQAPEVQFGAAHRVSVQPGGLLAALLERESIEVNSVHGQGMDRLAPGLRVEATAPDGLVEAYSVEGAPGFSLAVQWHPEWQAEHNEVSMRLFSAFGAAVRARANAQARRR